MEISSVQIDSIEITQSKKSLDYTNIASKILYVLLFLLPVFILPLSATSVAFSKTILLYFGISLAFLFWLLAKLQDGTLSIPKSGLLLSVFGLSVAWFVSALFSAHKKLSFVGKGYEPDTFFFIFFMSIALFLVSIFFQTEKKAFLFYLTVFSSGIIVFLFQFFKVLFGVSILPLNNLQLTTSNLVGSWNDLAIFFGFIALSSLVFFDLFKFSKRIRLSLISLTVMSLLSMAVVNFFTGWVIFGVFVVTFLVYLFTRNLFEVSVGEVAVGARKLFHFSLLVLVVVLFVILARGTMAEFSAKLDTAFVEIRPSWSATLDVAKESLKGNPAFGSGPNTFVYEWLKHKPTSINKTDFWATRFPSGIGFVPTAVVTTGLFGWFALLAFLVTLLFCGMKVLSYYEDELTRALTTACFLGSVYLWPFIVFYSPGITIIALAFLTTGLLIAMLVRAGKIKMIDFSFLDNPRSGFVSVLLIVFLLIGTVSSFYLFAQKALAVYNYEKAITSFKGGGDLSEVESRLDKAIRLDAWDEYYRTLSELSLVRLQSVISKVGLSKQELQDGFREALANAIQNAQKAVELNSEDPLNWMQIGRVYEVVVPFGVDGADTLALEAYNKVSEMYPSNPSSFLASARVKFQKKEMAEARTYLESALALKGDLAPALFMLSRVEVQAGNLDKAIEQTTKTAVLAPNDVGVLFQLGLLYYQKGDSDSSRVVLERVVELNANYANARYFLGLIYDKAGMTEKAIEQFENINKTNPDNSEIEKILENLYSNKASLESISPPGEAPEDRAIPPVND